ncbi:MAG: GNAT family N-acetyltransferase [Cyclobacteriaceae bacterium]
MDTAYNCLPMQVFKYGLYEVQPYRFQDLFKIKEWRNSQIDVLRQKKVLTDEDQIAYYQKIIEPSFKETHPRIILFSFLFDSELIGYGGLTNCSWEDKRSELSFLVSTIRATEEELYKNDFSAFIHLMTQVNFEILQFNRLFTETFDIRPLHITTLEKNGFVREGVMKEHVIIGGRSVDSVIHGLLRSYYKQNRI